MKGKAGEQFRLTLPYLPVCIPVPIFAFEPGLSWWGNAIRILWFPFYSHFVVPILQIKMARTSRFRSGFILFTYICGDNNMVKQVIFAARVPGHVQPIGRPCGTWLHYAMRDVKDMGQQMGYHSLEWNWPKEAIIINNNNRRLVTLKKP